MGETPALDPGQVLGIVDGRDSEDVGNWLFARSPQWRLSVQVVAIDLSAACGCGCRAPQSRSTRSTWSSSTTSCAPKSGNASPACPCRRSRFIYPVRASRRRLMRAGDTLPGRARQGSAPCSQPMTPPGNCRPRGWSKNSSGPC
ncbi:transposase [Arthrobacter sp. S13_S34]|nr:transposase [Arthrobacter sp. S13_S34]